MINLGDEVRDSISGFRGIAIAKHEYLHGCTRVSVAPKMGKDGKLGGTLAFDEPQLIVIKARVIKESGHDTGGPAVHIPRPRETGHRK